MGNYKLKKIYVKTCKLYIKMEKKLQNFVIMKLMKSKNKNFTKVFSTNFTYFNKNIDINKIVVSNKVYICKNGFKYFIDYKDIKKTRPWWIFLSKRNALRKETDETKYMPLLTKDAELFVQYDETWEKNYK